jgi:hypothetical protein
VIDLVNRSALAPEWNMHLACRTLLMAKLFLYWALVEQ